jgi:hypothetical protein
MIELALSVPVGTHGACFAANFNHQKYLTRLKNAELS